MNQKNREPGFYWVKINLYDEWQTAEWCDQFCFWLATGSDNAFRDNELYEIDERRITREEPQS